MMQALIYDAPETLRYGAADRPVPGAGEELIRVEAVGICGSDMHGYHGSDPRRVPPLILGHEAAGIIEGGPRDGTRVTVNPLVPCGICAFCKAERENICPDRQLISIPPRQGAFAQYLVMPAQNLVEVPETVPLDKAALAEPLSVSWHAAKLGLAALRPGNAQRALILGGGAIGLTSALCLKAQGLTEISIIELNEARANFLREKTGFEVVTEADGLHGLIVDAVGYDATREAASAAIEPGGVIVHIGLGAGTSGLDIRRITLQEVTFIGTYCYTPEEFRETAAAIYDGRLGALDWVEHRSLADGAGAFADLDAGQVAAPKIVLTPWS